MFHFNNHAPSLTLAGPPSYWHPLPLPLRSPSGRSPTNIQQTRTKYLGFLEQAVIVLLSQATRYLIDPEVSTQDKLQLKKELANELVSWYSRFQRTCKAKKIPTTVITHKPPPQKKQQQQQQQQQQLVPPTVDFRKLAKAEAREVAFYRVNT